ncbi:MAG: hypothetical protein Q9210_005106 [Variospora velana]
MPAFPPTQNWSKDFHRIGVGSESTICYSCHYSLPNYGSPVDTSERGAPNREAKCRTPTWGTSTAEIRGIFALGESKLNPSGDKRRYLRSALSNPDLHFRKETSLRRGIQSTEDRRIVLSIESSFYGPQQQPSFAKIIAPLAQYFRHLRVATAVTLPKQRTNGAGTKPPYSYNDAHATVCDDIEHWCPVARWTIQGCAEKKSGPAFLRALQK